MDVRDIRTVPDLLRHALEMHPKPDAFLVKRDGRWEPVSTEAFAGRVRIAACKPLCLVVRIARAQPLDGIA